MDQQTDQQNQPEDLEGQEIDDALEKMRQAELPFDKPLEQENKDALQQEPEKQQEPEGQQPEQQEPEAVPLAVALEWKKDAKRFGQEVSELKAQLQEIAETMRAAKGEPEPEVPSIDDSPIEFLAHQSADLKQQIKDLHASLDKAAEQNQAREVQSQMSAIEQKFAADQSDYWEATEFLAGKRLADYQNLLGMSEADARAKFSQEMAMFVDAATKRGESFAQAAYDLAKREGYQAKAAAAGDTTTTPKPDADKSLKEIARKQAQATTLAGRAGTGPKDDMTVADASELSDEDFDKQFLGEAGTKRMKEMMGG